MMMFILLVMVVLCSLSFRMGMVVSEHLEV